MDARRAGSSGSALGAYQGWLSASIRSYSVPASQLIDIEFRIITLERQKQRSDRLVYDNFLSREQYEAIIDELEYQRLILANTKARQNLENKIREDRTAQIALKIDKLEENLDLLSKSFENLLVRAPIAGQLTSLLAEIGENKNRGQRLGQIDVIEQYKIVAQVDEFYVSRVFPRTICSLHPGRLKSRSSSAEGLSRNQQRQFYH